MASSRTYAAPTQRLSELQHVLNNPAARLAMTLVHWPTRRHPRIQLDLAESIFVARDVLLQQSEQCLGLLRAQIDPLKISNLHLRFALLLQGAEDQKEVPDVHTHLHAVGVAFAVVRRICQFDIGLCWKGHKLAV